MADFKNLVVWQKARTLSLATIDAVESIKGNAPAIIRNQLIRSVLSIQSNIAEGSAKKSDREFARYVRIALGSATESENHLTLINDLSLVDKTTHAKLASQLSEVGRMLNGLEKRLTGDASKPK